jgi:ketosteroid isomerase-like protein
MTTQATKRTAGAKASAASGDDRFLELERRYWQAMKDRDLEAALRLTADPCLVSGSTGAMSVDRAAFRKMWEGEQRYSLDGFLFGDDVKLRMLTDDVAVIAYQVTEDVTVDGQPVHVEATETSTWIRQGDGWVCAVHSESIHGDSFGRDRTPSDRGGAKA